MITGAGSSLQDDVRLTFGVVCWLLAKRRREMKRVSGPEPVSKANAAIGWEESLGRWCFIAVRTCAPCHPPRLIRLLLIPTTIPQHFSITSAWQTVWIWTQSWDIHQD